MRIFIHADMEGVAGIDRLEQVRIGGEAYAEGCRMLVRELNLVTDLCFRHGATAVTISDTHGGGGNVATDQLDPRAGTSLPAWPRLMTGLEGHDGLFLLGHHAMAGTRAAFLEHSFSSSSIFGFEMDDRPVGEIGIEACYAAAHGVPTLLVSGDEATVQEASLELPEARGVAVKKATCRNRCSTYPLEEVKRRFDEAIAAVLAQPAPEATPVQWPRKMRRTCMRTDMADEFCDRHSGAERVDGCTVAWTATRPEQLVHP